jgi:L-lysine 6-transaminase
VEEVENHCFSESSRINSTWGGNLVDMLRCARFIEIIQEENLVENAAERGEQALQRLGELEREMPEVIGNVRGRGLFVAFDLDDPAIRPHVLQHAFEGGLLVLPSGKTSIRLRPALNVSADEIDEAVDRLRDAIKAALAGHRPADVGA